MGAKGARRGGGELRIIGGRWRGRRLRVLDAGGLRPTTDRIRETVFNWLQADVPGARCLDLFAGTGALGLEALSRGAAEVVFVEKNQRVAAALRDSLSRLEASQGQVILGDALGYLGNREALPFDVVFLDPPFRSELLPECLRLLPERGWLAENAVIYIEAEAELDLAGLVPEGWALVRSKMAGQVGYHLARKTA